MAKRIQKELSEDRKIASIEQWATSLKMDPKETSAILTEKYGPYAYDVMQMAMMKPSVLMSRVGASATNSKEAVEYMIKHILTPEELAKVIGKDAKTVQTELEAYHASHPRKEETQEERALREQQEEFNEQFNQRITEQGGKTVDPAKIDISKMTLDDYAKFCPPNEKPAKNFETLCDEAYIDFSKGEGKYNKIYLDCNGNPTIGVGHLIMPRNALGNASAEKAYRERFMSLPLKGLTPQQKEAQFNQILKCMKSGKAPSYGFQTTKIPGAGRNIKSPEFGQLDENGIREVFNQDFKHLYDKTKSVAKEIDQYPLSLQLAVIHMTFARGNANNLKTVDTSNLNSVFRVVNTSRKNASHGEKVTITEAGDTIRTAEKTIA